MISKKTVFVSLLSLGAMSLLTGCGNDVDVVKNGVLPAYSENVTVGNAVESWAKTQECTATNWESIITEREEKIIQFTCELNLDLLRTAEDMADNVTEASVSDAITNVAKVTKTSQDNVDQANNNRASASDGDSWTEKTLAYGQAVYDNAKAVDIAKNAVSDAKIRLAKKNIVKASLVMQFPVTVDGKSFNIGYIGRELLYVDNKESSKIYNNLFAYREINQNIAFTSEQLAPSVDEYDTRK